MRRYVVFLDIDGVFTSDRVQLGHTCEKHKMWDKFDPVAVDFMNTLDHKYNVEFVLSSTWKNKLDVNDTWIYHWMNSSFRNAGFRGVFPWPRWKTNPRNEEYQGFNDRAKEIMDYLEEFGPYDDYLIFDDTNYMFNETLPKKRWIRTDSENGLAVKQMKNVLSLVGEWEKK